MSSYKNLKFSVQDGIARLVLARPPLNVFSIGMLQELNAAVESLADSPEVRVLVFSSELKAFSAGIDMVDHTEERVFSMIEQFHTLFRNLQDIAVPTIAGVRGMALGGGCELAIFCDFVIAGESATFGQPEIKIGIFPPLAALFYPTVMGSRRATEMILLGENIDAQRAQAYGLITRVVPDEKVSDEVDKVATKLAGLSAAVLRTATRAVRIGVTSDFQAMLDQVEALYLNDLMSLEDSSEGVRAFMERRKPEWKNR